MQGSLKDCNSESAHRLERGPSVDPATTMARRIVKAKAASPPAPSAYLRVPDWMPGRWRPTESTWEDTREQAARAYRAELLNKHDPHQWVKEVVHVKWRPILGRTTDGRLARYGQEPELDLLMVNLGTSFLASLPTLEKLVALEDRQPMLALAAPPPVARAGNKPAA